MYRCTLGFRMKRPKAFTLVEVMTATFIALYTVLAAWSAYVMVWSWYHETNPEIEAERIARIALSTVIVGKADPTAGTYQIGSVTYQRRSGIAQATRVPTFPSPQAIDFGLEPDSSNARSYYLGVDHVDPVTGLNVNVVYYKDNAGAISKINSTVGITDLTFSNFNGQSNVISVTAIVERDIIGTAPTPRHIHVAYSQITVLKNVH